MSSDPGVHRTPGWGRAIGLSAAGFVEVAGTVLDCTTDVVLSWAL
jgi:hypothetical protein